MPARFNVRFVDAHNHLQDPRIEEVLPEVCSRYRERNLIAVVNGTRVNDWQAVYDIAKSSSGLIPSFGLHPWFLEDAPASWREILLQYLEAIPSGVGEVGLDRVRDDVPFEKQEEIFREQVEIAAMYNRPLSIHSVKSDEKLLAIMKSAAKPVNGFLMHSFTGSKETAGKLLDLGAYLSLSGVTLRHDGQKARTLLAYIPSDRLLLETDAPNQPVPIEAVYEGVTRLLKLDLKKLQEMLERNFSNLFGSILPVEPR